MSAIDPTLLPALEAIQGVLTGSQVSRTNLGCRVVRTEDETGEHVVLSVPRPPKADEAAIDIAAFRRECARLHSLPRASARNELDNCADCGKHATHTDYRNGRAIGLCSDCR